MLMRLLQVIYWLSVLLVLVGLYALAAKGKTDFLLLTAMFWVPGFLITFIGSGKFLLPPTR